MAKGNRRFIFHISADGASLSNKVRGLYPEAEPFKYSLERVKEVWPHAEAIIFIMASGIAVRAIASLIKDKKEDPGIIVVDEKGENIISLLSGHMGGANKITKELAGYLKGSAVITTGTDLNGLTAIDLFASEKGLKIENMELLAKTSAKHIKDKNLRVYSDSGLSFPADYEPATPARADVIISNRVYPHKILYLRPRDLILGIGLNSGTVAEEIENSTRVTLQKKGFSFNSIKALATHEKKLAEPGLIEFAKKHEFPLKGFSTEELNGVEGIQVSRAAKSALGVQAVAEPAAVLLANGPLLVPKIKRGNITLAIARADEKILYVIGTGPGGLDHITPQAVKAIRESDIIVGYRPYLAQIAPLIREKIVLSSGMTEEVARARAALESSKNGKKVSVISGGDAGIYGMAGLMLELAANSVDKTIRVEIIPGISALNACAARLGAPLMHDFAAISLSDRLTPWETIEDRLEAAARADFVIVLYNPKSRGRVRQIERARDIILKHRPGSTPVGVVRAATRENEETAITTLANMLTCGIDMQSTVIIGNSNTKRLGDRIVTPRGYERKYAL